MRFENVFIDAFGYQLPPQVVTSGELEERLESVYRRLHLQPGQLEALTGIRERRFWPRDFKLSRGAIEAGQKAFSSSGIKPSDIGILIYGGVCRENLEPATACAVAHGLGIGPRAQVYDVSNACLGVLNGMLQIANAIELGQVKAGMVVSCESARQIVELTIQRLLESPDMESVKYTLATLTGGSGAVAVILCHRSLSPNGHRLLGAVARTAPQHHRLCIWGPDTGIPASMPHVMRTDSVGVLQNGVALGIETFADFRRELGWSHDKPQKVICHQVGATHQRTILESIGLKEDQDFTTFRYLGNIGTVSLPITAAIAHERGFLESGDAAGFLGIGSGLNCMMLGVQW